MEFGRVDSPIDARHTETAGYAAADWATVIASGASLEMYLSGESGSAFEPSLEASPVRGRNRAIGSVLRNLQQPPVELSGAEMRKAEGHSV